MLFVNFQFAFEIHVHKSFTSTKLKFSLHSLKFYCIISGEFIKGGIYHE